MKGVVLAAVLGLLPAIAGATDPIALALLLSAHAQHLRLAGRVVSITTDCSVYQMTVTDG